MTKYVQINKTVLIAIVVILLLTTGFTLCHNMTASTPSGTGNQPFKDQPAEFYNNYSFNDLNACNGKVNSFINPLLYNNATKAYNHKFPYFNYYNSPEIIGCGGRRIPCDKRNAIPNILNPIDISNRNIAPITVRVDDNLDMELRKVGTIYKIFGNENQVFPLYGRNLYYDQNKWEYFTRMGQTLEYLRVFQQRQFQEFGNNDEAEVEGRCGKYRVSIYDRYIPQYIPFI